jgi:hypothetical protein
MKTITKFIHFGFASLALGCFTISPTARAVVPPPDGGYPGFNTAEGQNALLSLTTGAGNTAVGWLSLGSNAAGSFNTAVGAGALFTSTGTDGKNTAVGAAALLSDTNGIGNTATGVASLVMNASGDYNTADGAFALSNNTTGTGNTAIGTSALLSNTTGNFNVGLGEEGGAAVHTASHVICIGAIGDDVSDSCYIGNIFGATSPNGVAVLVNSDGRLGTVTSSKRFKEDIEPMGKISETLFSLKPVTFHYKKELDPACRAQFGLVAEDVERISPELVVRDKEGKPYSVRYDQVNAMLLNEFLKEHLKVEELTKDFQATVAQLTARLDEQAAQIQKVSAQLESSKPAPQVVNNP